MMNDTWSICMLCASLTLSPPLAQSAAAQAPAGAFPDNMQDGLSSFTMDNGMAVILRTERAAPVVSIQFWVGTGSAHEQDLLGAGLSHLIEHMIFKGTPARGPAEISRAISDVGGMINAYTSVDRTVFFVDLPSANWLTGFEILADALQNAAFPEDEWRREKEVIIREMAMCRDNPDNEVSRLLLEAAYRVHPYRVPVIGYEDIFRRLTREDLVAFFQRHYTPDNIILAVAGNIDPEQAAASIRATFKDFARRPRAPQALPQEPAQISPRAVRRSGPHKVGRMEQSWHTVALEHPDAPALDMLAIVTGSGRSARLVSRVVERDKLAHRIETWSFTPAEPGMFGISAVFDPEHETALCAAVYEEIRAWQQGPFSRAETEKARRIVINRIMQEWQTAHGQARNLASGLFYAGDPLFLQTYLRRLNQVAPEDLGRVAQRYLAPAGRTSAILLPEAPPAAQPSIPPAVVVPTVQKTVLSCGLPLLTMENRRLPLVNICVALQGGLRYETPANNGISCMMAELLTRGSPGRSAEQIAELVDNRGGSFTAFAGQNSFGLQAQCLSEDAEIFMELLAEGLLNPVFDAPELEKRRSVQTAMIAQQRESPVFLAQQLLRQMLFPEHPYRFTPEGQAETVAQITVQDLRAHHARLVTGGNAVLAIFGDIAHDRAAALAEKHLHAIARGPGPAVERNATAAAIKLPAARTQLAPKEQTIIMQGFPGVSLTDPRLEALNILQTILSGLSSDLMINIRDKEGLAYFAGAINRPGMEPGFFAVYAGIHHPALERVKQLITDELRRLAEGGTRPEELNRAREQMLARHLHNLQLNAELAQECALNELYGLGYDYSFRLEQRLRQITPADLAAAAAAVFLPAQSATAVVAPENTDGGADAMPAEGN